MLNLTPHCFVPLLFVIGCAGPGTADTGAGAVCVGSGTLWNESQQTTAWTTETADPGGDPLGARVWRDAARTALEEETWYEYDEVGFLVLLTWDMNGDGEADVGDAWQRTADGLVTAYVREVYEEPGEPRTVYRESYTYEDGVLVYSETDADGDGVAESSRSYTYDSERVVREEEYVGAEVNEVVTWTYPDPAPARDCVETHADPEGNVTATYTRTFTADGDLLSEEEVRNSERSLTTNTWESGQLVLTERDTDDFYGLWQYAYEDHGLLTYRRYDGDTGRDGVIEQANLDTWDWTCP